jgi:hypothetical protein
MKNASRIQDELLAQVRQGAQDYQRLAAMNAELLSMLERVEKWVLPAVSP